VDHDRTVKIVLAFLGGRTVLKLETFWQIEVELWAGGSA
jgi:hypothetical protein